MNTQDEFVKGLGEEGKQEAREFSIQLERLIQYCLLRDLFFTFEFSDEDHYFHVQGAAIGEDWKTKGKVIKVTIDYLIDDMENFYKLHARNEQRT